MRTLIVGLLVASCGKPTIPITEKTTVPTNMQEDKTAGVTGDKKKPQAAVDGWRSGPGDFPIPADADAGTQMLGTEITFQIPRARDVVHAEIKKHIKSVGYTIDSEQLYMGGHRMMVKSRQGRAFAVSVTENVTDDGKKTTLMTVAVK